MFNFKHYFNIKEIIFLEISNNFLNYKYNSVKESTYLKYKYIIEKYLYPDLNFLTLKQLLEFDFYNLINKFKNLDNTTTNLIITVLKSILKFAERKYNVDFKIDLIKYSNTSHSELQIFTQKEKQKLISYCYNDNSLKSIGILMCLYTGIRIGELCALKWENINLENDTILINKTLQRVYENNSTHILIDSPKSKSSIRKIPINKKLHNLLYAQKEINNYDFQAYFLTG